MTPKVSVIVPCYNLGEYLNEAIDSVLAQTLQDFEIIVVDDGSTDPNTQRLLEHWQRPKTRVVRAPHAGVSAARNTAIAGSTGPYLCALDPDDRLEPTYLEKASAVLDGDPSVAFVSCWARNFGDEQWDWKPERCDIPNLLWEDCVVTAALVRRDAVLSVGGYDTQIPVQGAEDWDLWLSLVERGFRGVILKEILFNYRRRAGSLSSISWYGTGHMAAAKYRIAKHRASYRAHLLDVFRAQDDETSRLLRRNDELERQIGSELEPAVAARREELEMLRARLGGHMGPPLRPENVSADSHKHVGAAPCGGPDDQIQRLEAGMNLLGAEIAAMRNSMSWRVTAPARDVYGRWLRWRGKPA